MASEERKQAKKEIWEEVQKQYTPDYEETDIEQLLVKVAFIGWYVSAKEPEFREDDDSPYKAMLEIIREYVEPELDRMSIEYTDPDDWLEYKEGDYFRLATEEEVRHRIQNSSGEYSRRYQSVGTDHMIKILRELIEDDHRHFSRSEIYQFTKDDEDYCPGVRTTYGEWKGYIEQIFMVKVNKPE